MDSRSERLLGLLLVVYVALSLGYWWVTPLYEGPDEPMHYAYVRHLVEERALPPLTGYEGGHPAHQETSQPPLYYTVAAALTFWAPDQGDSATLLARNPHFAYPAPPTVADNKNTWLHTAAEGFPWRGTVLAVRLTRLISLLFGMLGVWGTWALGRELWPDSMGLPLLAAGGAACVPQFLFMSTVVSNDVPTMALSAWALWAVARVARDPLPVTRSLTLGVLLGLAALTKVSALGLIPVALATLAVALGRRSTSPAEWLRWLVSRGAVVALAALVVGGWWYLRNWALYGNPFNTQVHLASPWAWDAPRSLAAAWKQMIGVERSFWAVFGTGNVGLPDWIYTGLRVGWLVAAGGWVVRLVRRRGSRPLTWAALWAWTLLIVALEVRWLQLVLAPWGRLLFPALAAMACLAVAGWRAWLPEGASARWLLVPGAGLLLLSALAPWVFIRPAFVRPPQVRPADLETMRVRDPHVIFDGRARLLDVTVDPQPARPGGWTWVEVCWEALGSFERDYEVFVHLVGPGDQLAAVRHTLTGLGRFPTGAWRPGDAFCDRIRLRVEEDAVAPAVYDVEVGLYDPQTGVRLEPRDREGNPVAPVFVGRAKVADPSPAPVQPPSPTRYRLGDQIALIGYDVEPRRVEAGTAMSLTLYWRAERRPDADYVAFVQLLSAEGELMAQADGPPRGAWYPTSWWAAGDVVVDRRTLPVPPDAAEGTYRVLVGLYRWETMERLPVEAEDGTLLPDGAITLTEVHIDP
jgi:hypothetical protein